MARRISIVAETEEVLSDEIRRLRTEKNFEAAFCALGPETIACINRSLPEAIVVVYPKADPSIMRLVEVLRSDPKSSNVPIVLCCVRTPDVEILLHQLQMLGIYTVRYPCDVDELVKTVEGAAPSKQPPQAV